MNKSTLIYMIGQRLSGRDEQDLADFISGEADLCQRDLLESGPELPWFLSRADEITVDTSGLFEIPEGFLLEDPDEGISIYANDSLIGMDKTDKRTALRYFKKSDVGTPKYYCLVGRNTVEVFPKPDKEYVIHFTAYYRDAAFSEIGEEESNAWMEEAPGVLLNETGKNCALILRDDSAFKFFATEASRARDQLMKKNMERRYVNQHFTIGG